MHFILATAVALGGLAILGAAAPTDILAERALGINCRGAGLCSGHLGEIAESIKGIDTSKTYQNGEHIACWKNALGTGMCAFLQDTKSGVVGSQIQALLQELQNHGCKGCGSVPIDFTSGSNDPANGILTVNYVGDRRGCDGICDVAKPPPPQDDDGDTADTQTFPTQVQVNFVGTTCSDDQKRTIQEEFNYAYEMALAAKNNPTLGPYYNHFFDEGSRNQADFQQKVTDVYDRMQKAFTGIDPDQIFLVSCDPTTNFCARKNYIAHANPEGGTFNFCPRFFANDVGSTKDLLDKCGELDIRSAQRARAAVILHESSHVGDIMGGTPSDDYAYGFTGCTQLARGEFDRSCAPYHSPKKPKCPDADGKEGPCDSALTFLNADTWAHVAAGVFFGGRCNRDIAFPDISGASAASANHCPFVTDYLIIDGDESLDNIEGYVHFGDSYASGMGTGTTTGDSCRVGSSNYGDLLRDWLPNKDSISYERHSCSGDTVQGLNGQIDKWSNPDKANVGTVTIGGNDVGFSDLVYYCVLTPNTARLGSTNRANCEDSEKKARQIMADEGPDGLRAKLKNAYLKILDKSGSKGFHLYVANYPTFFNEETTDCNDASFHYWWGANRPQSDWPTSRIVYLSQDLRKELNALVNTLNGVILNAVLDADREHGGNQIHYVDMNGRFSDGNHRWCEADAKDPDSNRQATWFFLSGWPDVDSDTASIESAEISDLIKQGPIKLPEGCTADGLLQRNWSENRDPYDLALCRVAAEIAEDPDGEQAKRFAQANQDITAGDVNSQSISWYLATRQIKTFHPRTPGMRAYRDAMIAEIQKQGQI